jgi:alkylated DNA repair dioxygenase AlkB
MPASETLSLFDVTRTLETLDIPDADIRFMHRFLDPPASRRYFDSLMSETPWDQPMIRVWGKEQRQPRLSCWYGDPDAMYRFSGKTFYPHPWTTTLRDLHQAVQAETGFQFNSVLLNLYRDGEDSIGMHSDNEDELGPMPVIASLSLGATRLFKLKHRQNKAPPTSIALPDGSLLLMAGRTQQCWLHGVRKERHTAGPRINLTFRQILTY